MVTYGRGSMVALAVRHAVSVVTVVGKEKVVTALAM